MKHRFFRQFTTRAGRLKLSGAKRLREEKPRRRICLRTNKEMGGDYTLDYYLFQDADHAVRWLSPDFQHNRYWVEIVIATDGIFDEHAKIHETLETLTVKEFLKRHPKP